METPKGACQMTEKRTGDRATFVRLANKRVPNAVKAIELIANLSNRSNYAYTDKDVATIMKTLKLALAECESRFSGKVVTSSGFSLE
jgi:hypothetical protein